MSNAEARRLVAWHYEDRGYAVYQGAQAVGKRTMPDLIILDRDIGVPSTVRVMVGKRPRPNGRLYHDPRRIGMHADILAVVDPVDGFVTFHACKDLPPHSGPQPEGYPPYAMRSGNQAVRA